MPDLLREQFPHFRPIVEAFGYRNLEFEGWEADDVIATLATRADEAGVKTCVVSTDRDAFQLCTENICLMMTPRGVADVHVYTPERVELRYGVRPDQVPDFIGLKGDTSDNIPGVPRDRRQDGGAADRPVRLARGGARARRRALARAAQEHHRARRPGAAVEGARDHAPRSGHRLRSLAARAGAARSLAAEGDVPPLRVPQSARPGRRARRGAARRGSAEDRRDDRVVARGRVPRARARACGPRDRGRPLRARPGRRRGRRRVEGRVRAPPRGRGARRARLQAAPAADHAAGRRHDARRVPDRAWAAALRAGRPRRGVRARGDPRAGGRGGDGGARPACGDAPAARRPDARAGRRARQPRSLPHDRAAAHRGAGLDGGRRREDRRVPHGRDHRAPRRPGRGAGGEGVRARGRGVHARLDAAGGADPVREARADPGPEGKDGLLDRHARPALDPRRARARAGDRGVARVLEAAQHVPRPAAEPDLGGGRTAAHDDQPGRRGDRPALDDDPNLQAIPIRTELGREIRSAFIAEPGHRSSSRPTTRRSSCGSSRTFPASRSCARRSRAARTSTRRPPRRCSARIRRR